MKNVLVLGAGRVAPPLVDYLLNTRVARLTVCDADAGRAAALAAGRDAARALALSISDAAALDAQVREHDLVVSLLPAPLHPAVAEVCIRHRRHLVTTSYVSPAMRGMDAAARAAGVVLLNEIGLDPGVDHLTALRTIDDARRRGASIMGFRSFCGGLPAPDANNNPWGYKFSWSPRGVCTAARNGAVYVEGGRRVELPNAALFAAMRLVPVDGVAGVDALEAYANRDSLSYVDAYGLAGVQSMLRGTLRYPGWCATFQAIVDLNLLDDAPAQQPAPTLRAWLAAHVGADASALEPALERRLPSPAGADVIARFRWLGLLDDAPLPTPPGPASSLDILAAQMERKLVYAPGERDMVVLKHEFDLREPDGAVTRLTSAIVDFGDPRGHSAMARTVGWPAAIASRLILENRFSEPGVHVPLRPDLYNPILDELATLGVRSVERCSAPAP